MFISLPSLSIVLVSLAFLIYIIVLLLVTIGNVQAIRMIYHIYNRYCCEQTHNSKLQAGNNGSTDIPSPSRKLVYVTDDDSINTSKHTIIPIVTTIVADDNKRDDNDDANQDDDHTVSLLLSPSISSSRLPVRSSNNPPGKVRPTVTIVKPLKGKEENLLYCLESFFHIQYSQPFEIIFTIESINDPAYSIAIDLIQRYPNIDARIILDYTNNKDTVPHHHRILMFPYPQNFPSYANPKAANCSKGVHYAKYDWILLSDSNVRAPVDYLDTLTDPIDNENIGLVSSSIVGIHSTPITDQVFTLGHQLELLTLNIHINRSVAFCNTMGVGIVSGKVIFFKKVLASNYSRDRGFDTLTDYMAEDFMSGYFVRQQGYKVVLTTAYVEQHVPSQFTFRQCWDRHVRWGRLRKTITIPGTILELLSNAIICGLLGAWAYMLYENSNVIFSSNNSSTNGTTSSSIDNWVYNITTVLTSLNWYPFYTFFVGHIVLWFSMDYCLYTMNYITYDYNQLCGARTLSSSSLSPSTVEEDNAVNIPPHRLQPLSMKEILRVWFNSIRRIIYGYEYPFLIVWLIREFCFGLPLWLSVICSNQVRWKDTTVRVGKNTLILPPTTKPS